MRELLSDRNACKILREEDRYFIEFDSGELVTKPVLIEVSREDAERAQLSEKDAYEVILKHQVRDGPGRAVGGGRE